MKKFIIQKIFYISIFIILKSNAYSSEPIHVRADYWCPYNCSPSDINQGYMIEILQKAFGEENIKYETMNWARAVTETREGGFDAIIGAAKEDAPDFIFSDILGKSQNCYYTFGKKVFKYTGIDSLKLIRLGIVKDYSYYEELNTHIKNNLADKTKIDETFGDYVLEKMIGKARNGEIDVFVEDPNVVNFYLKKHYDIKELKNAGCSPLENVYIAFSPKKKNSEERVEILNKTIKKMIKNGEMKKLLKKYSIPIWFK
jgi:polar amino acid transport system substrate-binding protein